MSRSEVTRQKIVDAALALFEEKGYEQTTMRAVATRAGVSLGNAYYYFPSKEALMQGYYGGLLSSFTERIQDVLHDEKRFSVRITRVLNAWIDNASPYHDFAGGFFRFAADPRSPLSPFSAESAPTRDGAIDIWRQVIDGSSRLKMSDELRPKLPELLWLYQMGIVLHWVYDNSDNQQLTRTLVERTAPLVERLVGLSRLPVLRTSTKEFVKLIDDLSRRGT